MTSIKRYTQRKDMDNNNILGKKLQVFPNPAKDRLSFVWNIPLHQIEQIELKIVTITGEIIWEDKAPTNHIYWDTSSIPNGIYFYQILYNNSILESDRIIIQK